MAGRGSTLVLQKVAQLLECIGAEGELTPREAAERIGEPTSTVYRLLSDLRELGFVEHGVEKGKYGLGIKLFRLGARAIDRLDVLRMAEPQMQELHEQTGETLFLCIRRNLEGVCISRLDGIRVHSVALQLGGSLPLHAGASPVALLAFEPEDEWDAYVREGGLVERDQMPAPTEKELRTKLQKTVERGYALSDQDVNIGIGAIAAPLFDYTGKVRASLSLSGVRQNILGEKKDSMVELLLGAAAEISTNLGYEPQASAGSSN